ncbi:hypothetical protein NC653_013943 [Populus alba x Populus x berolinensis]|uniref:Uncharacterized protein n=1 Tax=Populus alba x Populus x berolinensis TaxID=444605 RepID=A0AAD6QVW8_9ROSI|nr:hypothetical protein NC653_013943 [Populus alba x Populus x berolinensis]
MKIQLNFEFYFVRLLLRRIDALKQKAILQKLNWEVFILREEDYPCCFRYIQGYHEKGKDGLFYFACLCFIIALCVWRESDNLKAGIAGGTYRGLYVLVREKSHSRSCIDSAGVARCTGDKLLEMAKLGDIGFRFHVAWLIPEKSPDPSSYLQSILADPRAVLDLQWHEEVSKALQG